MELNEYQKLAMRTSGEYEGKYDKLMNGVLGLCGESGEIADYLKKGIFQGHPYSKHKVQEELGDVLWYVALMADSLEISLSDVARNNIEKLEKRYPNGFSVEDSIARVDTKEQG